MLGTVVAGTMALSDIPAGAWSDAFSRKWALVIGHALMGAGMVMTGVTDRVSVDRRDAGAVGTWAGHSLSRSWRLLPISCDVTCASPVSAPAGSIPDTRDSRFVITFACTASAR